MLVSYNWLKEEIDIDDNALKIADKLTQGGLEVEDVIKLDKDLSNLVVGYIVEKEKHPNAEKLNICKVDIGEENLLQIVCGASNVDVGQYVIVAKVGAKLPGIKIKKAKLRGIESEGMICSLKELGLEQSVIPKKYQEGIYVFDKEQEKGANIIEIFNLNDFIIDISITPNRADCLSVRGITYELSALYNKKHNINEELKNNKYKNTTLNLKVESENCNTYFAQVINNVKVENSPLWLQSKLMKSGIRPINNIVDVTNYVLLEYGQPMHAFDKNLLGNNILVRQANDGETIKTLDGEIRNLINTDLIITNGVKPIALAGVMGGKDEEVSEKTTSIVLESAYFNPTSIRKTSAYHSLRSDSSLRFEKGIDPNIQKIALQRAVELIKILCPEVEIENSIQIENNFIENKIEVSVDYINNFLGVDLSINEVKSIIKSLKLDIIKENANILTILVPSRRQDITIKQDIAEEIARIYGYDNIKSTLPKFSKNLKGGLTYKQKTIKNLRNMYSNIGFSDTINYSLISEEESRQFLLNKYNIVKLLMPMSENHSRLRQSLIPGLLNTLKYNQARKQTNLKLLEIGKVFFGSELTNVQPTEVLYMSAVISGKENVTKWLKEERDVDFYSIKAYLELTFEKLGILDKINYKKFNLENMHPGRTAGVYYEDELIGFIGELHPLYTRDLDLETTYIFELNLDKILTNDKKSVKYEEISKYPEVKRDIAILLDKKDNYSNIYNLLLKLNEKLINKIEVFDVYEGIGLVDDKKSIAITITYKDNNKTLEEEDILKVHSKVEEALIEYGVTIR